MRRRTCVPYVKETHVSTIIKQSQVAVTRARARVSNARGQ
jgi:hypothetical protein